ncbi:MAG TPA: hypothetical protein VFY84_11650, partial [Jiangellales bacterium]|nr:hypothetical protein [Jiangellales bacterium]
GDRGVDTLLVYEFFGLSVEIQPSDRAAPTQAARLGGAADAFRTITVYPGAATDQSAWGAPITP